MPLLHVLVYLIQFFFFFKQKTAYEMRISDWSSDVCSSDLVDRDHVRHEVDVRMRGGGRFQRLLHRHAGGVVDMDDAAMAVATLLRQMPALSPCFAGIEREIGRAHV